MGYMVDLELAGETNTARKPDKMPLYAPQITHELSWY
jgi:hypothetical protein